MQRLKLIIFLLSIGLLTGCSQLNKATDLLTNPTAKERYKRDFKVSDELFSLWEDQLTVALNDSIRIETPFLQSGHFTPRSFPIYSYNTELKIGEKLEVAVETDSIFQMVFIELYQLQNDSIGSYLHIKGSDFNRKSITHEVENGGIYKIVIQPEIYANSPFSIKIKTQPVYRFPVAGAKNTSIQSFWGATRDAGRRSHEGIDIFAPRGTPVIAVTEGQITSTGERGLGGKQVWLRDQKRNQSLYYAHLDSIAVDGRRRVRTGDTLGFVGNTGNARTTPPHLHFGIYKGSRGAIDPLHFVYQFDEPFFESPGEVPQAVNYITKSIANLRDFPATTRNSGIIGRLKAQDTIRVLGKTSHWYHIRTVDRQAGFLHESLVAPL